MRNFIALVAVACLSCACASLSVSPAAEYPEWFPQECIDTFDPWECEANHAE